MVACSCELAIPVVAVTATLHVVPNSFTISLKMHNKQLYVFNIVYILGNDSILPWTECYYVGRHYACKFDDTKARAENVR